jgi:hypothetical protein
MSWTLSVGLLLGVAALLALAVGRWLRAIAERDQIIARVRSYTDDYAAQKPSSRESLPCLHCGGPTGRAEYSLDSDLRRCKRCGRLRLSRSAA